jgi:hypothetical protein
MRGLPNLLLLFLLLSCAKESTSPTDLFRVITTPVSGVGITTAQSGGLVISGVQVASADIIARGVCYGQFPAPTIADPKTTDGSGSGEFVSEVTGLMPATKYYLRAYATIAQGTVYGEEYEFTTLPSQVPVMITIPATLVTHSTAQSGGQVLSDGGMLVVERGLCFGTTPYPTVAGSRTSDGAGRGMFVTQLEDLCTSTTYYVRAYATNAVGTGYSTQVQFTTTNLSGPVSYVTTVLAAQADFTQCLPSISGTVEFALEPSGEYAISDASFGMNECVYAITPSIGITLSVDCGAMTLSNSDQSAKTYTLESVTSNGTELTWVWNNSAGDRARTVLTRTGGWPLNLHL